MKIYQHTNTETFRGPLDSMSEALLPDVTKLPDLQQGLGAI